MASVFGVRKECLLCFDDLETEFEKKAMPFAERVVTRQMEKEAFRIYAGLYGCNVVLVDNSKYARMSLDDFTGKSAQEQASIVSDICDNSDLLYYSFQNRDGVEIGRCSSNEYNAMVKEISEFAEFKIRKMCEGVIQNAVDSRKAD